MSPRAHNRLKPKPPDADADYIRAWNDGWEAHAAHTAAANKSAMEGVIQVCPKCMQSERFCTCVAPHSVGGSQWINRRASTPAEFRAASRACAKALRELKKK